MKEGHSDKGENDPLKRTNLSGDKLIYSHMEDLPLGVMAPRQKVTHIWRHVFNFFSFKNGWVESEIIYIKA